MITSNQNPKIKRVRQLLSQAKIRKKQAAYVLEGIRLLEEAYQSNTDPDLILYTADLDPRGQDLVNGFSSRGIQCDQTTPEIFAAASDTKSPQGILAIMPIKSRELPGEPDFLLVADEIRDPGNLGTLMRTAAGAGVDGMILTPGSVDLFSPKVVRSAMGAHFRLPVLQATWPEIKEITQGLRFYLADMHKGKPLWETDLSGPVALIVGGEAHGAGQSARELADVFINIPMEEGTESLNAAAAGAVLLFEVRRQRSIRNK
jgi:TrmH family RNA methyltransferase